jgi:HEAT repeat protein
MDEQTKNLISLLLTDPDPDMRRRAAEDLAEYSDRNILSVLSIALQDKNKGVGDAVSRSLLSIGGAAAARAIVHHIEDDNLASRSMAAKLLFKLGKDSVHALVPYLRDADKDIRKIAVDILGEIKSKEPIYYLLPLLNDPDPNVLVSTLEALGNIGSSEAIELICGVFEKHPFARIIAIEALGKIGGNTARDYIESKFNEVIIDGNADETYVFSLLDAMGAVGNAKTLEIIQTNYKNIKGSLRNMLLHAMVQVIERCNLEYQFDHKVRNDLLQALHSDSQNIQLSAAKGLVQFKDPQVTRDLLFSLGISEEMDFVIIAQMSERPQVFQIAVECLEGGLIRGKIQIIMLLGKLAIEFIHSFKYYDNYPIGSGELNRAFAATAEFWREANQEDWEIIADTLFGFDSDRALEFLSSVIIELDPWSRVHVIERLAAMPTQRALDCIARFCNDENETVREAALSTLREAGYSKGVSTRTPLNESLENKADQNV